MAVELFDHPRGGHPFFLASRRASDGFASAGEFIWVIDELRLGLCDQCIGDITGRYLTDREWSGVWVSDRPLDNS